MKPPSINQIPPQPRYPAYLNRAPHRTKDKR